MHVLATDTSVHEAVKHLGMSHLYCESFAIAHHNCFVYSGWFSSNNHPIGQLLDNHIGNILAINALARKTLVAQYNNALDEFMSLRGTDFVEVIGRFFTEEDAHGIKNGSFTKIGYPYELGARGFGKTDGKRDLKQYYFQ